MSGSVSTPVLLDRASGEPETAKGEIESDVTTAVHRGEAEAVGFDALADQVAAVAEEHVAETDRDAVFPVAALEELRRTRLLGLLVPVEHGGLGGSVADVLRIGIRLGRVDMSLAMIFTMHCQQVAAVVRHAAEPLRSELLARLGSGAEYLASVTTEVGTGGHLLSAGSALRSDGAQLDVDRFAPIVTGGAHADGFLITMRAVEADSPNQVSLVYARRDQLTTEASGDWQPMGMRASHSIALQLTGAVPAHQVVGAPGGFADIAGSVFGPLAHLGWSAAWLGTAAGALSRVLRLLRSPAGRKRFDVKSELLLTRLSTARQRLDSVHALLWRTEEMVRTTSDLSLPRNQLLLNALKITAAEQCHAAVDDLVDAVGLRHGYLKDSPTRLEQALRDLRSAALNYSNDRLHLADGRLALMDAEVRFA
ncbi:Acyl-CoA dehydrogenase [Saccharopolyspora kobensis]|uniref:Acyl-CoA dehydrogenase n=1 Tax=Saccharopolyspora kobensis TaxID=146035 RepID=A0A1H6DSD4_9PSEU|nr:acyl-CoA dehydrogenase family protein [Saccharopolyspora kobensis]SEG88257.1 Acyl-CoA dehydrogenase [Saccharopolyspora kobensis]SFE02221.1 Acyl-CoA dehydrogenase [Saccharopolyspora kobensis]